MRIVELNRPALWRPIRNEDISIRVYVSTLRYVSPSRVILEASQEKPVYRYAKNYTVGKDTFSICIFTDESDVKKVEKYFKKIVKSLDDKAVKRALVKATARDWSYIKEYYGGSK